MKREKRRAGARNVRGIEAVRVQEGRTAIWMRARRVSAAPSSLFERKTPPPASSCERWNWGCAHSELASLQARSMQSEASKSACRAQDEEKELVPLLECSAPPREVCPR